MLLRLLQSAIGNRKLAMPLLVLVYVDVFSVDDVVFACAARRRCTCRRRLIAQPGFRSRRWRLLIKRFSQFVRRSLQLIESVVQSLNATFSQRLLRLGNRRLNFAATAPTFSRLSVSVFSIW